MCGRFVLLTDLRVITESFHRKQDFQCQSGNNCGETELHECFPRELLAILKPYPSDKMMMSQIDPNIAI